MYLASEFAFLPITQASAAGFRGFFMSGYNPETFPRCSGRYSGARRLGQVYIPFLITKTTVRHIGRLLAVQIA